MGSGFENVDKVQFRFVPDSDPDSITIVDGTVLSDSVVQIDSSIDTRDANIEVSHDNFTNVAHSTSCGGGSVCSNERNPICFGVSSTNSTVCSGRGRCTADDQCQCVSSESTGVNCEVDLCFGINSTDPSVCSGFGTCTSPNNCNCAAGKYGYNCRYPKCFEYLMEDASVCSGNGVCTQTDKCVCTLGWQGTQCDTPVCNHIPATDSNVCGGRGTCVAPDSCLCNSPYSGLLCKSPQMRIDAIQPDAVFSGENITVLGSGFVQTTGVISCQISYQGAVVQVVPAEIQYTSKLSCLVSLSGQNNDEYTIRLIRVGSDSNDADPSNDESFRLIVSALSSTSCSLDVPDSGGCLNYTTITTGSVVISSVLDQRRALQSTAKAPVLNMQGYVDFNITSLSGTGGTPLEFWFFDTSERPTFYTGLGIGGKISLSYDAGGGRNFQTSSATCNFDINTPYQLQLLIKKVGYEWVANATLFDRTNYASLCNIIHKPQGFDAPAFFSRNYSLVLSQSNYENGVAVSNSNAQATIFVKTMLLECQPEFCKKQADSSGVLSPPLAPEGFPWLSVVIPLIIIGILLLLIVAAAITAYLIFLYCRKNVYVNESVMEADIDDTDINDEMEGFNIGDDSNNLDYDDSIFVKNPSM